jgi:hypothetical protein
MCVFGEDRLLSYDEDPHIDAHLVQIRVPQYQRLRRSLGCAMIATVPPRGGLKGNPVKASDRRNPELSLQL